jgi:hypothetical protein
LLSRPTCTNYRSLIGGIAQLVERLVRNEKVRGSNPLTSTNLIVLVLVVVLVIGLR